MFVMYFPQMIAAGMVYRAVPPLYSVKQGSKNRYFTDQIDIVRYIQKLFLTKYKFEPLKGSIDNRAITSFLIKNADYIYYLEDVAHTYAVDQELLELILFNYLENKNSFNYDKLKKKITSTYRFMDIYKRNGTIIVSGTIKESNTIVLNDKLINDCSTILNIMNSNDAFYYKIDGKVESLYNIMLLYNKTSPSNIQRYKGLGEMNKDDLAESTLYPGSDRTLIKYTLEDAKEVLETVREYESDSKKILRLIDKKDIKREDLLE